MPKSLSVTEHQGVFIILNTQACQALNCEPNANWFNADYWHRQGKVSGHGLGRGKAYFIEENSQSYVMRHYRRGGLVQRVSADRFIYTGIENTRPFRELELLEYMGQRDLPVPLGVAARVDKVGMTYRADVLLHKIPHAQDLHTLLCSQPLDNGVWYKLGQTIKKMHQSQVNHHDLNIHNVMLDEAESLWIIDFDKCAIRSGDSWKKANLDRLNRSIIKESQKNALYQITQGYWDTLLAGYRRD